MPTPLPDAIAELRGALLDPDRLVRAVAAGRRRGASPTWRRAELRPVDLKDGRRLQLVRYDERQAHTTNLEYGAAASTAIDDLLGAPYGSWHVDTADATMQVRVTKRGAAQVHRTGPPPATQQRHDRAKGRLLDPADPLFDVIGGDAGKRRQVDAFLRVLDPALAGLEPADPTSLRVVDLGCGNAYLTFAAYRHLTAGRGLPVELVGVDLRAEAREHNQRLAKELGWQEQVSFVAGSILAAEVEPADVVLALHACDTATDEALARAVRWRAPLVLAAPCCQADLQRQLRERPPPSPYALLTRHAILRERYGDVLTDALRAALLRLVGYRVDVVEFVDSTHTPRNVLLRAVRTGAPPAPERVAEYVELTASWGVRPALERLLAPELAGVLPGPGAP